MSIAKRRILGIPHPMGVGLQPAIWLDANDSSTIKIGVGGVSLWADKSGHGNDVPQATTTFQPAYDAAGINVIGSINFDGVNTYLINKWGA